MKSLLFWIVATSMCNQAYNNKKNKKQNPEYMLYVYILTPSLISSSLPAPLFSLFWLADLSVSPPQKWIQALCYATYFAVSCKLFISSNYM